MSESLVLTKESVIAVIGAGKPQECPVAVVGAGAMGAGIAQIAAQAGHKVWLHDARAGAATEAHAKLKTTLDGLVAKGKLDAAAAGATLDRIVPATALADLADAAVVVEAIVENLAVKQGLFKELEALVAPQAVLASNTSSLSITALARGLAHPGRVVGMHFFNPVPLMKLVEVVSGLHTEPAVAEAIFKLSQAWGKTAVHAKSTPGFIVNRIARPFYAETLALLQEQAATPATIDALLRGAGFRMGPCELMDLIGHDVNYAVTEAVYAANYFDKRFQPSLVQKDLVDGGLLGRKSGRGFYRYPAPQADAATAPTVAPARSGMVTVSGQGAFAQRLGDALAAAGLSVNRDTGRREVTLRVANGLVLLTDGRPALQCAAELREHNVAVFDWVVTDTPATPLACAVAEGADAGFADEALALLAAAGFVPHRVADAAGLVVARTLAMLVNEAADAVQQGVCDPAAADAAMKLGVSYPAGPFEWLQRLGVAPIVTLLDHLDAHYRGERYRASPWLQRERWREHTHATAAR